MITIGELPLVANGYLEVLISRTDFGAFLTIKIRLKLFRYWKCAREESTLFNLACKLLAIPVNYYLH